MYPLIGCWVENKTVCMRGHPHTDGFVLYVFVILFRQKELCPLMPQ